MYKYSVIRKKMVCSRNVPKVMVAPIFLEYRAQGEKENMRSERYVRVKCAGTFPN